MSGAPRLSLYIDIIQPSATGTARLAANLRYIDSNEHPYTPRDGHNFHFQRLRADDSVIQKRNAYGQDDHDFKNNEVTAVCNDIATTFSGTTRTSSEDVKTAAINTGMPTFNDDTVTCTAVRTIHTAHCIITVIKA